MLPGLYSEEGMGWRQWEVVAVKIFTVTKVSLEARNTYIRRL